MTQDFNPDDLTDEQIMALANRMAEASDEPKMSRRDVLQLGGAGLAGALMGGGAATQSVQPARAAVGQGYFGTESNPLDSVFTNKLGNATEPVQSSVITDLKVENEPTEDDDVARLADVGSTGGGGMAATFVVAASDAQSQTGADYVCNGSSDEDEINQAISDLPTEGGRVMLTEGTYSIDGSITTQNQDGVTIQGQGMRNTVIVMTSYQNVFDLDDPVGWTIRDLQIDGNMGQLGDGGSREQQNGFYVHTGNDFLLENSYIHSTAYNNFRAVNDAGDGDGRNFTIINNFFGQTYSGASDTVSDHVSFAGRFTDGETYTGGTVGFNQMYNCGHVGIEIGYSEGFNVVGNIIENAESNSIGVHDSDTGEDPPNRAHTIRGNVVINSGLKDNRGGINIESKAFGVTSNVVFDSPNADFGIKVQERPGYSTKGLIVGNTVENVDTGYGYVIEQDNIVMVGNTAAGYDTAVLLDGSSGSTNASGAIIVANHLGESVTQNSVGTPSPIIDLNQ